MNYEAIEKSNLNLNNNIHRKGFSLNPLNFTENILEYLFTTPSYHEGYNNH